MSTPRLPGHRLYTYLLLYPCHPTTTKLLLTSILYAIHREASPHLHPIHNPPRDSPAPSPQTPYHRPPLTPPRRTATLNTGAEIPIIGLGTWQSGPNEVYNAVLSALKAGYRHIDTALAYGNESEVGAAIRDSGVPRADIWVTTKLDNPWHKRVPEGIDSSLKSLGLDYVDLYLIHWPSSTTPEDLKKHHEGWDYVDTWKEMQKLPETGKVKNIGVSNFGITHLERLLSDPSCKVCFRLIPSSSPPTASASPPRESDIFKSQC